MPVESGVGRERQNVIYRAGIADGRPAVPTDYAELERRAHAAMSEKAWAYVAGGAGEGSTMVANRRALDRWKIVPRVLRDVSQRSLAVDLFGQRLPAPLLVSPVGAGGLVARNADVTIGKAAASLGLPYIFSNQGSAPMEDVAAAMDAVSPGAPRWFQLYWSVDEQLVDSFLNRAEAMGAAAIAVTLDTTMLGWRPQDLNLGSLPFARGEGIAQYTRDPRFRAIVDERVANPDPDAASPKPSVGAIKTLASIARNAPGNWWRNLVDKHPRAAVETFLEIYSRPSLSWADIEDLRARTPLPIVLKGVLHPDDARHAVDIGVDGIIVSNHGGRTLDTAPPTAVALPRVAQAVAGAVPVLVDGGIRRGTDVLKAMALGASAVLVGRPAVHGLAHAGAAGVAHVLRLLRDELEVAMALTGCKTLADAPAALSAD